MQNEAMFENLRTLNIHRDFFKKILYIHTQKYTSFGFILPYLFISVKQLEQERFFV